MVFLGCLFDRKNEDIYLKKSRCGISNAVNGYQWNLIDGLNANLEKPVSIINALPVGIWKKQYKDIVLKDIQWQYDGADNYELGCINLPIIKQYQRYKKSLKLLKRSKDRNVLIYSPYLPFLKAAYKLDKSYTVTLVVTDLPEYYDLGNVSKTKRILRKINNKYVYKYMKRIDKFVLLTDKMKEPLQVGDRSYTVVEGICNPNLVSGAAASAENPEEKIILYTGTIHEKFGICNLLKAFSMIESSNYKLWICGGGDMREKVEQAAAEDSRIQFFGYVSKAQINKMQQQATVLINPRQNNEEYTKYSFPSKTMEYMLSGKPVIMYKLDGIPEEYDDYLCYVNDNSTEALCNKIIDICSLPKKDRDAIGLKARQFLISEKNNVIQAKKIIEML